MPLVGLNRLPRGLRLWRCLHRRWCLGQLRLGLCLPLRSVLLAVLVLAPAPPAPMPLRLPLAIGRSWPQFKLRLRRFCRHACTSWLFTVCCTAFFGSAVCLPATELPLPAACPGRDGEHHGMRSSHYEDTRKMPRSLASHAICPDSLKNCSIAALPPSIKKPPQEFPPVFRIDAVRPVLSSGNALPMGVSAAGA